MRELPPRLAWLNDELADWNAAGLRRRRRVCTPLPGGRCRLDGEELRNFSANDYLGLAQDPRVCEAATEVLREAGVGSGASALVSGRTPWHERLEAALAAFENQNAALLFPSGLAANIGAIAALAGSEDVVFCDRFNHASLVDGCRLSGSRMRIYRHSDLTGFARSLAKASDARRRWIVTDSVFSMDGDLAPLPELTNLADQYSAGLIIDEAHATGVFGECGRGVAELAGVEDRIDVRIGTLSKALGGLGGFVAGPAELIEYLWNRARTQVYSTALPPAVCAAAMTALEILQKEPERRQRLWTLSEQLRQGLKDRGIEPYPGSTGPIVPIVLGSPAAAVAAAAQLKDRGYLVGAIRPPTVPQGTARLRISLSAVHREEDVAGLVTAIAEVVGRR